MNNQYNSQQPQESAPQQVPQQSVPQQNNIPQQPAPQYQQPYMQQYQAASVRPPKPYVDPAVAKKQKQDAINAFGDKLSDLLNTNPILKIIAQHADLYSYATTGICVLFTIIALIASNVNMILFTFNLGGEVGGCFIFSLLAVIFGGLSLCKKKMLPLTAAMSAVTALMFTRFIVNIVTFATFGELASSVMGSGGAVSGGVVINFIFMILELAGVGFLTYICWTYFLAALPERAATQPVYQQPYNPQQNNMQQTAVPQQQTVFAAQQAAAPSEPQQNFASPQPAPAPSVHGVACPNCQTVNVSDALFCQQCGTKLK